VKTNKGNIVRLSDIAASSKARRQQPFGGAWFNRQPSVLLIITKQGDFECDRDGRCDPRADP